MHVAGIQLAIILFVGHAVLPGHLVLQQACIVFHEDTDVIEELLFRYLIIFEDAQDVLEKLLGNAKLVLEQGVLLLQLLLRLSMLVL